MAKLVNVVVNIQDYNPEFTYIAYIRPKGSVINFETYPQYTKTATSNQLIFDALPEADYEVGMKKRCGKEGETEIVWGEPVSVACPVPMVEFDGTTFEITLNNVISSYEWRVDDDEWKEVASNDSLDHTLTLAAINTALDDYEADRQNAIVDFQFRTICSKGQKSEIKHIYNLADPEVLPAITKLKTTCEGGNYKSVKLRFTLGDDSGDSEDLIFNQGGTPVYVGSYNRTNDIEADIEHYRQYFSGFNKIKHIDGVDPTSILGMSFDFVSNVPPQGGLVPVPCGEYDIDFTVENPV